MVTNSFVVLKFQVQATDADTGIFGQVSYSISAVSNSKNPNDNAISKFRISGTLGVVDCIGSVSGDEQYTITVRAADGGTGLDQRCMSRAVGFQVL